MEIRNDAGGKPLVTVRGGVKEVCEQLGVTKLLVSISHCRTHATAYAIAVGDEKEGGRRKAEGGEEKGAG